MLKSRRNKFFIHCFSECACSPKYDKNLEYERLAVDYLPRFMARVCASSMKHIEHEGL